MTVPRGVPQWQWYGASVGAATVDRTVSNIAGTVEAVPAFSVIPYRPNRCRWWLESEGRECDGWQIKQSDYCIGHSRAAGKAVADPVADLVALVATLPSAS